MAARNVAVGPRPPLADRVTPGQWQALDVVAAVLVALWVVFDLRLPREPRPVGAAARAVAARRHMSQKDPFSRSSTTSCWRHTA